MIRIVFCCHGNICRSPMAEYIMKEIVRREGREDEFEISSCAVSCEELGNGVYPPARAELERRGIPCGKHRAVRLEAEDYEDYDLFIVMDSGNLRWAREILNGDPEGKLHRLMEYAGENRDVSDPWYSRRFDIAFDDIMSGCEGLLSEL